MSKFSLDKDNKRAYGARAEQWREKAHRISDPDIDNNLSESVINSEKSIEKAVKSDIIKPRVITIGKSVGAAGKNYPVRLPDGNHTKFAEGTEITKIKVFAGNGTNVSIRNKVYLEAKYKIAADKWQKVRGEGTVVFKGKNRTAEIHWYEADEERVEMKVKRWLDES